MVTTDSTTDKLQMAVHEAWRAKHDIETQRRTRKAELWKRVEEATRQVEDQIEVEFEELMKASIAAERKAQAALDARLIETAQGRAKWPLGTKVIHWKDDSPRFSREYKWVPSGKTGVYEVYRNGDLLAANKSDLPKPGEAFIRINKKDGKPGLDFSVFKNYGSWAGSGTWLPEGETPKGSAYDNAE